MWSADNWKDYELLDCSDGQRLERWGKYVLIRPDPQVLWKNCKQHPMWKHADAVYTRSGSGGEAGTATRCLRNGILVTEGSFFLLNQDGL